MALEGVSAERAFAPQRSPKPLLGCETLIKLHSTLDFVVYNIPIPLCGSDVEVQQFQS